VFPINPLRPSKVSIKDGF